MPKPRSMNDNDVEIARAYLLKKNPYMISAGELHRIHSGKALLQWCDKHLNEKEIRTMRAAVRKARERLERPRDEKRSSQNLRPKAIAVLKQLSDEENLNYSEIIETYLGPIAQMSQHARRELAKSGNFKK